eukprot:GEMP01012713.1.p1 GENE.GEMP01012713.1~~GEMP01012713.1.p1  ORF type:complete len:472 (+),score=119.33 GEMP01012713.1:99-1418(+)
MRYGRQHRNSSNNLDEVATRQGLHFGGDGVISESSNMGGEVEDNASSRQAFYDKLRPLEPCADARVHAMQCSEGPDGRLGAIVSPSPELQAQTPTSRLVSEASHFSFERRVQRLVDAFTSLEPAILSEIGGFQQVKRKVTLTIQEKPSAMESMFALREQKQKSELAETGGGTNGGSPRSGPEGLRTTTEKEGSLIGGNGGESDSTIPIDKETLAKILSPVGQKSALSAVAYDEARKKKEKEAAAGCAKGKGKGPPPPPPKGKGKGKSPPPPPANKGKGKGEGEKGNESGDTQEEKEEEMRKPELTPGVAMRPLFWNSFRNPRKAGGETVWHSIDRLDRGPTFSTKELERHFGVVEKGKKSRPTKQSSSSCVAQRKMHIFEEGRRCQIVVMLRRLPPNVFPAILHMDDTILSADQVSLLLDNLPPPEELTLIARARVRRC